jgi:uncharacterized membrane protein YbaN (DUF454 family)
MKRPIDNGIRCLLIAAGTISLSLGIVGIIVPILPTTPFLLLAAACYARSSPRFYDWLLNNKYLGAYIRNYLEKKGVPLKVKIFTIALLWITISLSIILISLDLVVTIILLIVAIGVTTHILCLKTTKRPHVF